MSKKILTLLFVVLWALPALAQDVDTAWVRTYNGSGNNTDVARGIAVDDSSNVYVTGQSWGTYYDYVTIKYDPNGDQVWEKRYNGSGNGDDIACAIALDGFDNICVTGQSWGANFDYITIKYNPNGDQLWLMPFNWAGWADVARDISADASGNVYVTGYSTVPGPPPPPYPIDYFTIKYDPNGEVAWSRNFNGPAGGDDSASAIAVDNYGNVYVTGQCKISSSPYTQRGIGTVKYDAGGNFVWAKYIPPPPNTINNYAFDIVVDASSNVYITGRGVGYGGFDYYTAKYASDGTELWIRTYNGPGNGNDEALAIAVDGSGNVYVTGQSTGSGTGLDYATVKYDPSGTQLWDRRYNGTGNTDDFASAITLDGSGNIYVGGGSIGSGSGFDFATVKYDPNGTQLWDRRYNGTGNTDDAVYDIAVDNSGNVYVTGHSGGSGTSQDYATIKYWQNYAPNSFSLLSPENGAFVSSPVSFDWEDATDPDPWDTVKYDLYVSTSPVFHPDSTDIYDSLLTSEYSDSFQLGAYYWKVRAYDKRAEVWSNETWNFVISSPTALVGYWKFDEGEGDIAYDSSGYGNDGTLMNGPTWVDGLPLLSKALQFDAVDDYVAIPQLYSSSPSEITVSAWINSPLVKETPSYIVYHGDNGEFALAVASRPGSDPNIVYFAVKLASEGWYDTESSFPISPNTWHHLAGVWTKGDSLKIYVDGVLAGDTAVPDAYLYDPSPVWLPAIGAYNSGGAVHFFEGQIDQIKVYTRAFSPEEIEAEFEAGFTRGDTNGDGIIDLGDVVYLISYLYRDGPAPNPIEAGDVTCDGVVDVGDVVYLISYLYRGGPPPPPSC